MKICTYGNRDADTMILQPVDGREIQMIPAEISLVRKLAKKDFCLLACVVDDWNRDLSPWRAEAVFGNEPFEGKADEMLAFIRREVVENNKGKQLLIGGYSLAGLFALWTAYRTDEFCGVAAASPSVWFPGFLQYANDNDIRTDRVYLSLGDKEEKTKNPVMATVGDAIRSLNKLYDGRKLKTVLEWNQGNHFKEPELRMAKAFAWGLADCEQ